ncbi:LLM class flavin-dependent oxidoreductase [Alphaproteobacteria bacterium]|nr:LLM class flavin-dependent oxidoreductase [Alphaproteobacteria bacterium]
MKFSLFVHMERSNKNQSYLDLYNDFIALCKIADKGGMYTIWTGEHHCMDFTIAPNPFVTIADLANKLKNSRLGTGTIVAPFWNPIKLAEEAAITDLLTSGRLELGVARGAYSYEYERLIPGMDVNEAGERLREMIPVIRSLWKGNYSHNGRYYKFPKSTSTPKPLQSNGPPIWIAARDPNSHEFAIKNNCNVQVTPLSQGYDEIDILMSRFIESKKKLKPSSNSKIMLLQHTFVSNNEDDLEEAANKLSEFYAYFNAWFKNERPINQAQIKKFSTKEIQSLPNCSSKLMKKNLAIGTSKEIIELIKKYEYLGYDEFSYWIDSGMNFDLKKASLERFINEVMPAFN